MPTETLETPVASAPLVEVPKEGLDKLRETLINPPAEVKTPVVKEVVVAPSTEIKATPAAKIEVAAPADEIEVFTKDISPKSKDRFNDLATKKAEALFQERMKAVKLLTPEAEEKLTAAEKRAQDLESELRQSAIERSPEYKQKFIERPKAIRASLTELAKAWEIPEGDLIGAIEGGKESRQKLNTLLESIGTMDRADATELAREFQRIQEDKVKVLSDFETAQKVLGEKRMTEMKDSVQKLITTRSDALKNNVLPQFEKEYSTVFEGSEGDKLKSTVIGHIENLNACDLEAMKPDDRAAMIACAFSAQPLKNALIAAKSRISELEAKLSAQDSGLPAVGGRSTTTPAEEKPKGFLERMREEIGSPR